jgi:hypothetical protein
VAGYSVTYSVVDNATKQIDQITRRIQQMRAPTERMGKSLQRFVDVSGLRKVAGAFTWIGQAAAGAFRSIVAIVPALGALTSAATIAGMAKLVGHFAEWGKTLQINARQIGINADELQKWEDATSRAGGSAEDMAESLKALHQASANALLKGGDTLAYFNRLHISLRDGNGQLRSATDLMPEVFKGLDSLADPADRARVAAALLGDEQNKVYEAYRLSGKSLEDWLRGEEQHQRLTDEQIKSLNQYRLAMADVGTTFDQLGRQIGAVLAKNLTPFIQHLNDFVQKHQPEIIAAIDAISTRFGAWLNDPTTWANFEKGARTVADTLKYVIDHLDTITKMAEWIAILFATKWALGIVGSIAQVVTALGTASGVVTGTGLLGALAGVAALASVLALKGDTGPGVDELQRKQYGPPLTPEQQQTAVDKANKEGGYGYTGSFWHDLGVGISHGMGAVGRRIMNGPEAIQRESSTPFQGTQKEFTDSTYNDILAAAKARGVANPEVIARVGAAQSALETGYGKHVVGNNYFGIKAGGGVGTGGVSAQTTENVGGQNVSTTASFAGFGSKQESAAGYVDFLMKNPRYRALLDAKTDEEANAALARSGYATDPSYGSKVANIQGRIAANAPAAPPPPAGTINGAVDVSITHRNPPPDATVSAKGSGSVNVAPLRTERPQVSFADA